MGASALKTKTMDDKILLHKVQSLETKRMNKAKKKKKANVTVFFLIFRPIYFRKIVYKREKKGEKNV
jgi:hypothetical protein